MTDIKVMNVQGGFRAGRGCNAQIFVVEQIVEKTIECQEEIKYLCKLIISSDESMGSNGVKKRNGIRDDWGYWKYTVLQRNE